jgi:hypothetical protein
VKGLAIVIAAALLYPVVVLAGGGARFPDRGECVRAAVDGAPIDAVFGRFDSQAAAEVRVRRAQELGFQGIRSEGDGCGRLKVVVHGVPSLAVGRELVQEARRVGLAVTLERAGP